MAINIKDIIKYYIGHNVSDKLKERVLDRLSNTRDDDKTDEVLRESMESEQILPTWKMKKSLPHITVFLKQKLQKKKQSQKRIESSILQE